MSHPVEQAKAIVGKSYTAGNAKLMQEIVAGQTVQVLSTGYVRQVPGNDTYVVVDDNEKVIAIVVGGGE